MKPTMEKPDNQVVHANTMTPPKTTGNEKPASLAPFGHRVIPKTTDTYVGIPGDGIVPG